MLATLVAIASTLLALPGRYLTKVLIDEVAPGKDVGLLVLVLVATASSSLFLGLTGTVQSLFSQRLGALMGIDFQQRLLRRVQAGVRALFPAAARHHRGGAAGRGARRVRRPSHSQRDCPAQRVGSRDREREAPVGPQQLLLSGAVARDV